MHKQCLHGIAHPGTLDFGIERNVLRHIQVGICIYVNMTNPFIMLQNRNFRIFHHKTDQPFASPGYDEIDKFFLI